MLSSRHHFYNFTSGITDSYETICGKQLQKPTVEEGHELAATSVLAQEEYTVLLCLDNSAPVTYKDGAPMTGTWVMPGVLGRRVVILVWDPL